LQRSITSNSTPYGQDYVDQAAPEAQSSGKPENAYLCLIILISLNFENKEDKQNKRDFWLIFDLYFIQIKKTVFLSTIRRFKYNKGLNLKLCSKKKKKKKKSTISEKLPVPRVNIRTAYQTNIMRSGWPRATIFST
jgi:hypothetical protein